MTPLELILSRLDKHVPSGKNRYVACCPAHDDRDPSLSITEANDGRVLIHCFAGCEALSIVDALGLSLGDLFPPDLVAQQPAHKPLIRTKEVIATVDEWVLEIARNARKQGKKLSPQDRERERQAFLRVASQAQTA